MATRLKAFASHLNTKRADIAALRAAEPSASGRSDTELLSFLLACDCDREKAAAKLRAADSMIASFGKVTIADIAPWLRAPSPDRRIPDGCVVLLEDMNGGVARDTLGRPIMACIGMQHGTAEEMCRQYLYVAKRLLEHSYARPDLPPGAACTVIDVVPQEAGAPVSFRFPDKDVRVIFGMQELCFPGALFSSSHFCGLPMFVTWAFRLVRPFMRRETFEAMVLKPSFSHLVGNHIQREQMLPRWGGSLQFDLDEYIDWRAREEGVDLSTLCPRGAGKSFDARAAAASQAAALEAASRGSEETTTSGAAGRVTAPDFDAGAVKHGIVSKRGSGQGLFSTVRWKRKLLVLTPHALGYFDALDATDSSNTLARSVPLRCGDASVERVQGSPGHDHQFRVRTGGRDYLFAADGSSDADGWVHAIEEVIRGTRQAEATLASAKPVQLEESSAVEVACRLHVSGAEQAEASEARAMKLTPSQVEVMEYLDEEECESSLRERPLPHTAVRPVQ